MTVDAPFLSTEAWFTNANTISPKSESRLTSVFLPFYLDLGCLPITPATLLQLQSTIRFHPSGKSHCRYRYGENNSGIVEKQSINLCLGGGSCVSGVVYILTCSSYHCRRGCHKANVTESALSDLRPSSFHIPSLWHVIITPIRKSDEVLNMVLQCVMANLMGLGVAKREPSDVAII